jgi:DNA-binding HxlR family transcriptional regulator
MDERLVQDCNQILCLLLDGKMHVNETKRKTGLPKKRLFKARDFLEMANFLLKRPSDKHKQKIDLELTLMGMKYALFMKNVEKFENAYERFVKSEQENYHSVIHLSKEARKSLLLSKSWHPDEIEDYVHNYEDIMYFEVDSLHMILDALINVYGIFLLRFNPNEYCKGLISRTFSINMSFYIQKKLDKAYPLDYQMSCKKCGHDLSKQIVKRNWLKKVGEIYKNNGDLIFDRLNDYVPSIIGNRFIGSGVKEIFFVIFDIMDLPKHYVEQLVDRETKLMKSPETGKEDSQMRLFYNALLNRL